MKTALASSYRFKVTRSQRSCTAPLWQEMVVDNNVDAANKKSHMLKEMDGHLSLKGHDLHREPMEPLLQQQLADTADSTVAWRKPLPSPTT